jgi:hypothetical protein
MISDRTDRSSTLTSGLLSAGQPLRASLWSAVRALAVKGLGNLDVDGLIHRLGILKREEQRDGLGGAHRRLYFGNWAGRDKIGSRRRRPRETLRVSGLAARVCPNGAVPRPWSGRPTVPGGRKRNQVAVDHSQAAATRPLLVLDTSTRTTDFGPNVTAASMPSAQHRLAAVGAHLTAAQGERRPLEVPPTNPPALSVEARHLAGEGDRQVLDARPRLPHPGRWIMDGARRR